MVVLFLPRSSGGFHFRTYYFCWRNIELQPRALKGNVVAMTLTVDELKMSLSEWEAFPGRRLFPLSAV